MKYRISGTTDIRFIGVVPDSGVGNLPGYDVSRLRRLRITPNTPKSEAERAYDKLKPRGIRMTIPICAVVKR